MQTRIKIGISTCLLGENVRYDGQSSLARHLQSPLSDYLDFFPLCPEVSCGMGVPREPIRLVGTLESHRLIGRESGKDWTETMQGWGKNALELIRKENLCGFILKAKSPSCGMERVKVFPEEGGQPTSYAGQGLFAHMLLQNFPLMPIEEDGRLHDIHLRSNFIERIFVEHRWNCMQQGHVSLGQLIDFHTRHKMLIRSHGVKGYNALGKLVAQGKQLGMDTLLTQYKQLLGQALSLKPTIKKNIDVLMHIMGYFKKQLTADEKQECLEILENYRHELVPLIVPVTLLNHYVRKYDVAYLREQYYLNPHPIELKLRNHA